MSGQNEDLLVYLGEKSLSLIWNKFGEETHHCWKHTFGHKQVEGGGYELHCRMLSSQNMAPT